MVIKAHLVSGKVSSNSVLAQDLHSSKKFGEKIQDKIFYSNPEAFYLLKSKKMEIFDVRDKKLSFKEVEKKFSRLDSSFQDKFIVFKDLRSKGYIVKSGLKFGAEFMIYESKKPHAKWICFPVTESKKFSWQDFTSKNRVAHSTKKKLLIAIVDDRCDVSYFEVNWTKP